MAIDDLDLEFEDEEEKEKGDALDLDVDLSFSASPEREKAIEAARAAKGRAAPKPLDKSGPNKPTVINNNENKVSDINQARKSSPQPGAPAPRPQAKPLTQAKPAPQYDAYDEVKTLRAEVQALKEKMNLVEQQAEIKIAIAEAEKEYLVEYVSNAKVLDHQITQMLQRINAKVPQLKGEVQMIKKHMTEFLAKSNPKKKE